MRIVAPMLPLISEEIWRGLTGGRSVHLTDYPEVGEIDADLVAVMDEVRNVVSAAHSLRKAHKLRVRQPLRTLSVVTSLDLAPYAELIKSEVNVKDVQIQSASESGLEVSTDLAVLPRELDPSVRKFTSALFKAAKSGQWEEVDGGVKMLIDPEIVLEPHQYELTTSVSAEEGSVATVLASGAFVVLDTVLDAELEAEGYARDVIRAIQDQRKAEDLHVADRIRLTLTVPQERIDAVKTHEEMICAETLAVECEVLSGEFQVAVEKVN